jgi:hypothetical protein
VFSVFKFSSVCKPPDIGADTNAEIRNYSELKRMLERISLHIVQRDYHLHVRHSELHTCVAFEVLAAVKCLVDRKNPNVSEEEIASIFRV